MVGLEPSYFRSLLRTTKYGTFVPSFEVAWSCSTTRPEASNCGGRVLAGLRVPVEASPSEREDGVRKPVRPRKNWSSEVLVVSMETARLSGISSFLRAQPCGVWV